jgi:branched-chain amino acid transport system substrate-binding protein
MDRRLAAYLDQGIKKEVLKMKRILLVLVSILMLALLLPACAAPPPSEAKVLKLGMSMPLSGPVSFIGLECQRAGEIAVEEINNAGGFVVGGERYKWELIALDDKFNSADALAVAHRLIDAEGVKYIVTLADASHLSIQTISEPAGVITISYPGTKDVTTPDSPLSFRGTATFEVTPVNYDWFTRNMPEIKTVMNVITDDKAGEGVQAVSTACAKAFGIETLDSITYSRATTDFAPVVAKILDADPDLILFPGTGAPLLIKQARELGYTGHMGGANYINPAWAQQAGAEAVEGIFGAYSDSFTENAPPQIQELEAKFKERHDVGLIIGGMNTYNVIYVLTEALKKAGTVDTGEVADVMRTQKFDSPFGGQVEFGGKGIYGIDCAMMVPIWIGQFKAGQIEFQELIPASEMTTAMEKIMPYYES